MYNALNGRESDAGAFKFVRLVQPLKHSKQFVYVLHIKTHPIVPNEYYQLISVSSAYPISISARTRVRVNLTAFAIRLTSTTLSIERSP